MESINQRSTDAYEYRETTTATTLAGAFASEADRRVFDHLRERMLDEYSALDDERRTAYENNDRVFKVTRKMPGLPEYTREYLHGNNDNKWGIGFGSAMSAGEARIDPESLQAPLCEPSLVVPWEAIEQRDQHLSVSTDEERMRLHVEDAPTEIPTTARVAIAADDSEVTIRIFCPEEQTYARRPLQFIPEAVAQRIAGRDGQFAERTSAFLTGMALGYPEEAVEFYSTSVDERVPTGMPMAERVVQMTSAGRLDEADCIALKLFSCVVRPTEDDILEAVQTGHDYAAALRTLDDQYDVTAGQRVLDELGYVERTSGAATTTR